MAAIAFELATAYVSLVPSAKGITTGISQAVDRETPGIQKKLSGTFKAVALGAGAAFAAIKIGSFLEGTIKEFQESAKIGRLTEQVIKSTGGAAHVSAAQVGELANSLAAKTGIDDEVIQSGENVLATFTNVRNEVGAGNDIFNQATVAATNMSAALGTDMQGSVIQLGKALNDPIKGITALSRVGVSFTAQQKDQIATLVQSGDVLGAQKIILQELSKEFGGAAEAAADPLARLQVILGNFKETLGGAVFPIVSQLAPVLSDVLNQLGPVLGQALGSVISAVQPILPALAPVATLLGNVLASAAKALAPALAVIAPVFGQIASVVGAALVPAIGSLSPLLASVGLVFAALAPVIGPIAQVVSILAQVLGAVLTPVIGSIASVLTDLVSTVIPPLSAAFAGMQPVIVSIAETIGNRLGAVLQQLAPVLGEVATILLGALSEAFDAIRPVLPELADSALTLLEALVPLAGTVLPPLAQGLALVVQALTPLAPILPQIVAGFLAFKAASTGLNVVGAVTGPLGQVRTLIGGISDVAATKGVSGFTAFRNAIASSVRESAGFQKLSAVKSTISSIGSSLKTGATAMADFGKKAAVAAVNLAKQTAAFVAQKAASIAASVATKALAVAQGILNAVMAVNPFVLIVVGIAALVAGLILAYNKVGWFRDLVDTAFSFIQDVIGTLVDFVAENWPILLAVLTGGLGIAVALIVANWDTITSIFTDAISTIVDFVSSYWPLIFAVLTGGLSLVVGFVIDNWSTITSIFSTALNLILSVITTIVGAIVSFWQAEWAFVVAVATGVWGFITAAVAAGLGFVRGAFDAFAGAFMGAWSGFWNGLTSVVSSIAGAVAAAFGVVIDGIKGVWNGFVSLWNGFSFDFDIPEVDLGPIGSFGGGSISIDLPNLPRLAIGGIVPATPGGTLALLGEGRHDEAVIPLPRLSELFKDFEVGTNRTSNTVINVTALKPGTPLARDIADELAWDAKTNGRD